MSKDKRYLLKRRRNQLIKCLVNNRHFDSLQCTQNTASNVAKEADLFISENCDTISCAIYYVRI